MLHPGVTATPAVRSICQILDIIHLPTNNSELRSRHGLIKQEETAAGHRQKSTFLFAFQLLLQASLSFFFVPLTTKRLVTRFPYLYTSIQA